MSRSARWMRSRATEMAVELQRIWQANRKTVIFVTHSIREAAFLSDRVLVMGRRPATIIDELTIDLPRPRHIAVTEDETFNRLVRHLRKRSRPAMRNNIGKYAATIGWPLLVTALILLAWELSVRALGIRSIILPPPSAVFEAMAQRHDLLLAHLWPSLYLTVLGFLFSVIGGIFVAVLITYSAIVRKGFYPVIVVS